MASHTPFGFPRLDFEEVHWTINLCANHTFVLLVQVKAFHAARRDLFRTLAAAATGLHTVADLLSL
jgi:hypothetical protein